MSYLHEVVQDFLWVAAIHLPDDLLQLGALGDGVGDGVREVEAHLRKTKLMLDKK